MALSDAATCMPPQHVVLCGAADFVSHAHRKLLVKEIQTNRQVSNRKDKRELLKCIQRSTEKAAVQHLQTHCDIKFSHTTTYPVGVPYCGWPG